MKYEEAMEYMQEVNQYGSVLGLENTKELLLRLGNPQNDLKFIHIAGTNGKGSTGAYIGTILAQCGYLVGRYISPTIFEYCERIQQMRGDQVQYISKEAVGEYLSKIREVIAKMQKDGCPHPTAFEVETAMAFLYFRQIQCDVVVLEVGMGGRLDSTNVIATVILSVLTSISMDHMQYLGTSLEEIAYEKAGIIKPGIPVVSYDQPEEAERVIKKVCREKGCTCTFMDSMQIQNALHSFTGITFDYKEQKNLQVTLLGENQVKNTALALEAVKVLVELGYQITEEFVRLGLRKTKWPGRFSLLHQHPYVFVDGAHNVDAAVSLRTSVELYFTNRKIIYIMGVLADKEYREILKITAPYADKIFTITPDSPRALPSAALKRAAEEYHDKVQDGRHITQALELALNEAGTEDVILAFGSLTFLGEIYRYFETR